MLAQATPLLLVGAGQMGGAMLARWLDLGLDPNRVAVLDPQIEAERSAALAKAGVLLAADPTALDGQRFAVLILAIKPQSMAEALPTISRLVADETLIVSVAAGIRLETIEQAFSARQPVVRVMPNTPAQIGMGMSVGVANRHVTHAQRAALDALFAAVGKFAWADDEAQMDAVTAVSGSGPAYVFLLAECLAEAGRHAGLPDVLADLLGRQTVVGAGALLAESSLDPAALRKNVTSPKGTTAAALDVLMADDGLQPLLTRAVEAAKRRSIALG